MPISRREFVKGGLALLGLGALGACTGVNQLVRPRLLELKADIRLTGRGKAIT